MKYSVAAVIAAAAGAYAGSNVTYTTEVVESFVTYCPAATELTHGGKTYTVTEATTLTITDCPCTLTKPVITSSAVVCHNCPSVAPSVAPTVAPTASPSGFSNSTLVPVVPSTPAATGGSSASATGSSPSSVPTAGAGKVAALSGAGLAGIVGLAAFVL